MEAFQPNKPSIEHKSHVLMLYYAHPKHEYFVEKNFLSQLKIHLGQEILSVLPL